MKKILVGLINYNNSSDTIECIDSFSQEDLVLVDILVIDNSTDFREYNTVKDRYINHGNFFIHKSNCNMGFAKAANLCVKLSNDWGYKYTFLLNNDTVLFEGAVKNLADSKVFDESNTFAVIPTILNNSTGRIWNCGGYINRFGFRKYRFVDRNLHEVNSKPVQISFVTGCAILLKNKIFQELGGFTEDFFFGEDDFNLCSRMLNTNYQMYHIPNSIISHKVSSTISKEGRANLNKLLLYYVNRFIDIKLMYGWIYYALFVSMNIFYIMLFTLFSSEYKVRFSFFRELLKISFKNNSVDYELFKYILNFDLSC